MKQTPLTQALEYIRKESGKTAFTMYEYHGYYVRNHYKTTLTSFSKEAVATFVKNNKNLSEEETLVLLEMSPTHYLLVDNDHTSGYDDEVFDAYDPDTYDSNILIIANNDLAIDQNISIELKTDYSDLLKKLTYKNPEKVMFFNGLNKKEELSKRVKLFNDGMYRNEKKDERFKNLPVAYRAHKTTPKRKSGLRQLENSVRRMW